MREPMQRLRVWGPLIAAVMVALVMGAVTLTSGIVGTNLANLVALHELWGGTTVLVNHHGANAYLAGLVESAHGHYAEAADLLRAASNTHGEFARIGLARTLALAGEPAAGRAVLNLAKDVELSVYGDILLTQWSTAPGDEKQAYLDLLRVRSPDWLLPYANRLLEADQGSDVVAWAQATPDYEHSPDALVMAGLGLAAQGNHRQASDLFGRAYALRKDYVTAYRYGIALVLLDMPERGASVLEQALALAPPDAALRPYIWQELGAVYARIGRCEQAAAAFDHAKTSDTSEAAHQRIAAIMDAYHTQCSNLQ